MNNILPEIIKNDIADIVVILQGEIVGGGTLANIKKIEESKRQLKNNFDMKEYNGGRMTIINGAGRLLDNDGLIKKIISKN